MDMSSFWRTPGRATLRDIALVCVADALVGASFGAVAVSGGLPLWVPVAMSLLVFAGGAQFAALGVALAGGAPLAAVATGLVLNARHLPFGLAVAAVLSGPRWARLLGSHLMTDETVAFTLRHEDPARRRATYWLSGLALFAVWNLSVLLGALGAHAIGDVNALGLDAAFPAVLLALVLPALAARTIRRPALRGAGRQTDDEAAPRSRSSDRPPSSRWPPIGPCACIAPCRADRRARRSGAAAGPHFVICAGK